MVDVFLNSYESYIKELNDYISINKKSQAKMNVIFEETPNKLIMKKNDEVVYDLNKPKYMLIDALINSNTNKLLESQKKYRTLVLKYLNDDDDKITLDLLSDRVNNILQIKSKLSKLISRKNHFTFHNLISDYESIKPQIVNVNIGEKTQKKTKDKTVKNLKSKLKEKLIDENTEELNEDDLKVFMFKSLKECAAHPSKNNNAVSKDKLITKILENPKLKARLPKSYRMKSKEELCKILFPN